MTMLDNDKKSALCAAIKTSRYSRKVVSLLRDMTDSLYKNDVQFSLQNFESSMDSELYDVLHGLLEGADSNNVMETEKVLREVIEYLKNIEEVNFVIPIHPGRDFVKRIFEWCANSLNKEVLIGFTTNRLMDSGLVMIYKGYYFEYSLENLLNEYFSSYDIQKHFSESE